MLNRQSTSLPDATVQTLCRLMDSDVSADEVESACAAWLADSALRSHWHDWQLIGDVMRSGDLAVPPAHDEQFLHSLRGRLGAEPDHPEADDDDAAAAPANPLRHTPRRRRWLAPVVGVAGIGFVASMVAFTRTAPDSSPSRGAPAAVQAAAPKARTAVLSAGMLRDAGLDRYVSAHRKLPSGAEMPGRAERQVQFVLDGK